MDINWSKFRIVAGAGAFAALLYGMVTVPITSSHVQKLEVTEMKMCRWACGHTLRDRAVKSMRPSRVFSIARSEKASFPIFGKLLLSSQVPRNIRRAHWKSTFGPYHLRQYWRKLLKLLYSTGSTTLYPRKLTNANSGDYPAPVQRTLWWRWSTRGTRLPTSRILSYECSL